MTICHDAGRAGVVLPEAAHLRCGLREAGRRAGWSEPHGRLGGSTLAKAVESRYRRTPGERHGRPDAPGWIPCPLISRKQLLRRAWNSYCEIEGPGWLDSQAVTKKRSPVMPWRSPGPTAPRGISSRAGHASEFRRWPLPRVRPPWSTECPLRGRPRPPVPLMPVCRSSPVEDEW